jgi:archaellum component FlaC
MELILNLVGVVIVIFSLLLVFQNNRKNGKKEEELENYETELVHMKRHLEEIDNKIKSSSIEKYRELEKLMKECERKIAVFEDKISQGKNLKNILEKTFEKVSNVEIVTPKVNEDVNKNYGVEDILGLYRQGKTVTEISKITGKSLEEIAEMMGI